MVDISVADQWQSVRAITNLWNALGTSEEWKSSAVTMRGSIHAVIVSASALTVSTCTAISTCNAISCFGIQHFLVRYTGTDSRVLSTATTEH